MKVFNIEEISTNLEGIKIVCNKLDTNRIRLYFYPYNCSHSTLLNVCSN